LINVTYAGDTLMATKVTGDINVPRGEVSFTVDMAPEGKSEWSSGDKPSRGADHVPVAPGALASTLVRFRGKGQIAKPGFKDNRFVDGQFVLYDNPETFCFTWMPTSHVVYFQRPSSEQTLSLLRDTVAQEDMMENMRQHLNTCFDLDMTTSLARQYATAWEDDTLDLNFKRTPQKTIDDDAEDTDPTVYFRRISLRQELQRLDQAAKGESSSNNPFWNLSKWTRSFIDNVTKIASSSQEPEDSPTDPPVTTNLSVFQ
jgi:Cyclin D1 binding domain